MQEQQAPNYQQYVQQQNYVIPATQQSLNYARVNNYSQPYQSAPMYNPIQPMQYRGQQAYHQQQNDTAMPSVSSMISPPIDFPSKSTPPWMKNRNQQFVLPSIEAKTPSLAMSSFMMNEQKLERYTETPVALPLECHLGPGTPSPSLPSRSPSGTPPPLMDPSVFMRLTFDEELSIEKQTGNTKKRKSSTDVVKSHVKRYRRTKAEIAAAKRDELIRQLKPCTIIVETIDLIDSSATRFREYSSAQYNNSVLKPNTCRVPRMKLVPNKFTKVVNIGFMRTTNGIALSCMVNHCKYKSYRPIDFRKHLDTWHIDQGSSSKCQLCYMTLAGNLELELKHTIEMHIRSIRNMHCNPILYSKIIPMPHPIKKLKEEPREEPPSDVESEVESDNDSQAETDPESSAETEILSDNECDKTSAATEVVAEIDTPIEPVLMVVNTPESFTKTGSDIINESNINYDAVNECLDEIENILAPNSVCPESQEDDPDYVPPNSEPESEDDVAVPSDGEGSKETSSKYEGSSESEESLADSLLLSLSRLRKKTSCEETTTPAKDSAEKEPIRKLRIAFRDSSSRSSVSSANTDEINLKNNNSIITRRKSLALEKDLIVQCLDSQKCDPEGSIVESLPSKIKQELKKKVKFADTQKIENCEPDKSKIVLPKLDKDEALLSKIRNSIDKTEEIKEKKPSVDKKLEAFDFFTRIPASIVERIKLAKFSSVKSENGDEPSTDDTSSQNLENVADKVKETENSATVESPTEYETDNTPTHAVQEVSQEKELQEVALPVPPMTTQEKFQFQEDLLFKPKKIRPTARKRTQTVVGKKQRIAWCPEECVIRMKLIPSYELERLIASPSRFSDKAGEHNQSAIRMSSSDAVNISTVSDLGLNEIEYEEKMDESHGEPPIPAVDFPALMESTPKKSCNRTEQSEEEEVFYDSQDFLEPLSATTDVLIEPLFKEVITESMPKEPLKNLAELYPWIDDDIVEKWSKAQSYAKALLDTKCLFSTFKCMSIECSYFSTSLVEFKKHLRKHTSDKHFLCSFCLCDETDPGDLIAHIKEFHRQDRYQCSKCMYRSCEKFYCDSHRKKFHSNQQVSIFKSPIQKCFLAHRKAAFEAEKLKLDEKVKPIQCKCKLLWFAIQRMLKLLFFS